MEKYAAAARIASNRSVNFAFANPVIPIDKIDEGNENEVHKNETPLFLPLFWHLLTAKSPYLGAFFVSILRDFKGENKHFLTQLSKNKIAHDHKRHKKQLSESSHGKNVGPR